MRRILVYRSNVNGFVLFQIGHFFRIFFSFRHSTSFKINPLFTLLLKKNQANFVQLISTALKLIRIRIHNEKMQTDLNWDLCALKHILLGMKFN